MLYIFKDKVIVILMFFMPLFFIITQLIFNFFDIPSWLHLLKTPGEAQESCYWGCAGSETRLLIIVIQGSDASGAVLALPNTSALISLSWF